MVNQLEWKEETTQCQERMEQGQKEQDQLEVKEEGKEDREEEIETAMDRYPPHQGDNVNVQTAVMNKTTGQEPPVLRSIVLNVESL